MKQRADLTFKHNLGLRRHGWLRLTPAYSIKVVEQILDQHPGFKRVLEPFSGTATTGLVCGERGISCTCFDINPFLVWFGTVKTAAYSEKARQDAARCLARLRTVPKGNWIPPLFQIEKWWAPQRLELLAGLHRWLESLPLGTSRDLLSIAFCRCLMDWSNAAFNHQSMSFKPAEEASLFGRDEKDHLVDDFQRLAESIIDSAAWPVPGHVEIKLADARLLPDQGEPYDALITSPPYPNRMSYIRELRPYMYWMRYLTDAKQAGELDWRAIGGTWGAATSLVGAWNPKNQNISHPSFADTIANIRERSPLLANYVHKYFVDMTEHIQSAAKLLTPGAPVFYIVGNSKFYDTMVHVEEIYASLLSAAGFSNVRIEKLRKRNSKKELFEFLVSGTRCGVDVHRDSARARDIDNESASIRNAPPEAEAVRNYFSQQALELEPQSKV